MIEEQELKQIEQASNLLCDPAPIVVHHLIKEIRRLNALNKETQDEDI